MVTSPKKDQDVISRYSPGANRSIRKPVACDKFAMPLETWGGTGWS